MVPNTWLSGFLLLVQLLGKYMVIGHLDPGGEPKTLAIFSPLNPYMSYSLNSLKGGYIGDYIGDYHRGY